MDLCLDELVPRLKRLARQIDARAVIFGLMCHLGWGLQAAQLLGCCTTERAIQLLEQSCRHGAGRGRRRGLSLRMAQVDLTQLHVRQEQGPEDPCLFDTAAAEAFTKIADWLRTMSAVTSDLVVLTCVADILAHALDGQDVKVIEAVWEWIRELALTPPHSG